MKQDAVEHNSPDSDGLSLTLCRMPLLRKLDDKNANTFHFLFTSSADGSESDFSLIPTICSPRKKNKN